MIVYHGSSSENFKVLEHKNSRYGFEALFFATTIDLARLYASYRSEKDGNFRGGYVYEFEIEEPRRKVDFLLNHSYCPEFRSLIYKLKNENIPSAWIYNVMDYPSKKLRRPNLSDVVVLFDFNEIKSYKRIQNNVFFFK